MNSLVQFVAVAAGACVALAGNSAGAASADYMYQSALFGGSSSGGISITPEQAIGVRFQLAGPARLEQIGGNLGGEPGGNREIVGAVVRLSDISDFPDSRDLSTPDVLTHVNFIPNLDFTEDIYVPITPIEVPAGTYGLVFTSGLFGAAGTGFAWWGNFDIGSPSYFSFTDFYGYWQNDTFDGTRFFVLGTVPEPTTATLLALLLLGFCRKRWARRFGGTRMRWLQPERSRS